MSSNVVWNYFKKCETDASKAKCNECDKLYSLGSDKPRLQTTLAYNIRLFGFAY